MRTNQESLPWYVQDNLTGFSIKSHSSSRTRQDSLVCTLPKDGKLKDMQKSNAEFIVKACNCHYEVLNLLEISVSMLKILVPKDTSVREHVKNCKEIIAKANGICLTEDVYSIEPDPGPVTNVFDDLDYDQINYLFKAKGEE